MATFRQRGGFRVVAAAGAIDPWLGYAFGFQTGFNSEADGIFNIFASLASPGDSDGAVNALYAIEPWCASNPDKTFATALVVLAYRLKARTTTEPALLPR
jgi:hypothetical protein